MEDATRRFNAIDNKTEMKEILTSVYHSLVVKGYNPINQLVGYILSEDPTYITNYNNARSLICRLDRDELLQDLLAEERKLGYGFRPLSWKEIADLASIWHKSGEKIVFTNGCFDILHVGHVSYLEKAAKLGRHLILGLNSDDSVRRLKGEIRPLVRELDRARILASLSCVDAVVIFHEDTPTKLIQLIRPDILVKGGDYRPDQVAGREYAGKVEIIKFEEGYSTTGLVEKIAGLVREGKL